MVGKDTACAAGTRLYVGIDGLIPGASRFTQKTCSTAGPLCIIHPNAISWAEVPLSLPVPITQHTPGSAFVQCLVIHMGAGGAVLLILHGEGVFEFFHPR